MMVGKEDLGLSLSLGCSTTGAERRGIDNNSNVNNPPTATGSLNRIFQLTSSSSPSSSFSPFQLNIMIPSSSSSAPPTSLHSNPFAAVMHKTPTWNQDNSPFFHHFSVDRTSDTTRATTNTTGTVAEPRSFLRGIDVNRLPASNNADEDDVGVSSPNSTISSISGKRCEREAVTTPPAVGAAASAGSGDDERTCSRGGGSDDEDGDTSRKKLRLSKDQSAILEESFKEHNTLNPKQKLALAKRLGLRPRQVEVWFQNRRARTKLKQTEVDCEFLKRCCEQLTEENRRLQKEVQELRALKLSPQFYMQMTPPTTLTMCPSCERVGGGGGGGGVPPPQLPASASASAANSDSRAGVVSQNHHHHQHHRAPAAAAPLALNPWGVRPFEALRPRS